MNPLRACALFLLCVSHLVFGQQPENQVRAQLLSPVEAVLALEVDGDARAYPIQVLVWHELVNDTVGGVPAPAAAA